MIKTGKKLIVKTPKKIYNNIPWILSPKTTTTPRNGTPRDGLLDSGDETWTESLLTGKPSVSDKPGNNPAVPKGFVTVYVGPGLKRFQIPAKYLSMPDFRALMDMTAEEYGFEQEGPLELPCEEDDFIEALSRCVSKDKKRSGLKL